MIEGLRIISIVCGIISTIIIVAFLLNARRQGNKLINEYERQLAERCEYERQLAELHKLKNKINLLINKEKF